jgi:23S rRNA (adenine2503-C2)-methyltransferase
MYAGRCWTSEARVPRSLIYDLSLPDLTALMHEWGEPTYRARQVWNHVYERLTPGPLAMTDLPRPLRERLTEAFDFEGLRPLAESVSTDGGTRKTLFGLPDGESIEVVLMRYERRRTICISTQVGCAMDCGFCATGQMGFRRNLSAGEIVAQVLAGARHEHLTNIVVMGMGEPFHNYEATMTALDRLNDPQGFGFGERRMTVSTVGLIPGIDRFAAEQRQINLAVSLHAATDELRSRLLPVNRRYPLEPLFESCRRYVQSTRRRISFEWALIEGVNDGAEQALALAGLARGLTCHVNLIPLNPTHGYSGSAASRERAGGFREALQSHGISATIRLRRGIDIQAGCGQLATREANQRDGAPAP